MAAALSLARRGLGSTWPNPAVGCVLVRDGRVVGRGWTQPGGRPHAETEALRRAGDSARGATAYVTLEPCAHYGKTGPCADALVEAGIARVVSACTDPDDRVAGKGHARLAASGVAVTVGVMAEEAHAVNLGFFSRLLHDRPMVTLKLASSLDGRIATHGGHSKWITGDTARSWGHGLRATHDAIMVGIGTALADDPDLTCRLPGLADRSPVRVVMDGRLRLPLTSRLVATAARTPTWVVCLNGTDRRRAKVMTDAGVTVIEVAGGDSPMGRGTLDPARAMAELAHRGLTRVLVEGGANLAASLLDADLVDQVAWFRAPGIIGGDGIPAVAGFGLDRVDRMPRFVRRAVHRVGDDVLETLERDRTTDGCRAVHGGGS